MSIGIANTQVTIPSGSGSWSSLTGKLVNGQVIPYADAGISRTGPSSLAIGNGTAGNTSGSLALSQVTATYFQVSGSGGYISNGGAGIIGISANLLAVGANLSVTGYYADSTGSAGTNGQILSSTGAGTGTAWINPSPGFVNPMTTGGDIIIENATPAPARLGVGTTGQVLTVVAGLPAWAAAVNAPVLVNAQTSSVSAYTAVLTDANQLVTMSDASASTFTVPPNSGVAFPVGTTLTVIQFGAGQITLTAGVGVTIDNPSSLTTRTQNSTVAVVQVAANVWVAGGDLT